MVTITCDQCGKQVTGGALIVGGGKVRRIFVDVSLEDGSSKTYDFDSLACMRAKLNG